MERILVEYNGSTFDHGYIDFERLDECETNVKLNAHATIVNKDRVAFYEEIAKVFQKYAI